MTWGVAGSIRSPAGLTCGAWASVTEIWPLPDARSLDNPCVVARNESGRVFVLGTTACSCQSSNPVVDSALRGDAPRDRLGRPQSSDPEEIPLAQANQREATMRAVVHRRYGPPDVLRLEQVTRPTPAEDEVLIRVRATTVNRTDCGFRAAEPFFIRLMTGP
jgi:hypothetical protein